MTSYHLKIADHPIKVIFEDDALFTFDQAPSYLPFCHDDIPGQPLYEFRCVGSLPIPDGSRPRYIDKIKASTGFVEIYDCVSSYLIHLYSIDDVRVSSIMIEKSEPLIRCQTYGIKKDRIFGFSNAFMIGFSYMAAPVKTAIIHASVVRHRGKAYAFLAESGTGKSTHSSLWLAHIPGCDLMNDDNPIIREDENGRFTLYGSPWSGKTPCYRDVSAPLESLQLIVRDKTNHVTRLPLGACITTVIESLSAPTWDEDRFRDINIFTQDIINRLPLYGIHCRPDAEAAITANRALTKKEP